MSTLTIDLISSLDGLAGAEGWPGYWGKAGPEVMAWFQQKLAEDHTLVMGATTYRMMAKVVSEGDDPTFARMAEIPKVVFSKTLKPPLSWANTRIERDMVPALRAMKADGPPIRTMGSVSLSATLLRERLVDFVQVVVFNVVTSVTGKEPIYQGWPVLDLELVESRIFDGQLQLLRYVPTLH